MGLLLPLLSARLIVYTAVVLITAILLAALLFWSHSIFLAIPLDRVCAHWRRSAPTI